MPRGDASHFGHALREPWVQDKIMAYLKTHDSPLLSREIVAATGLTNFQVCRALPRLHDQGRVTRYKIPMTQRAGHRRPDGKIAPFRITKQMWLYSLADSER